MFISGLFLSALFGSVLRGTFFGGGFFVSEIGLILLQTFNVVFLLACEQLQPSFGGVDFMGRFVQTLLGVLNAAFLGGESRFIVIAGLQRGSQQESQSQENQDCFHSGGVNASGTGVIQAGAYFLPRGTFMLMMLGP